MNRRSVTRPLHSTHPTPHATRYSTAQKLMWCAVPLAAGLLALAFMPVAIAQEAVVRTITVTGQGEETIPTTLTQVNLGVEVQADTADAAQRQAAQRAEAVVSLLRSRNVQNLQTTEIRLNPVYNYDGSTPRITGYTATNIVSFRLDTNDVGTLLDDAIAAGATRIDNISFVATDAAIEAARQQALAEAAQDAQEQAEAVLSSLGFTAQEIISIQVNGANPPMPVPLARFDAQVAEAASTPVVGGEQDVQAAITLQIRY
ncbi:MAG: SIMPL domain-containing protein [Thainema sp.]